MQLLRALPDRPPVGRLSAGALHDLPQPERRLGLPVAGVAGGGQPRSSRTAMAACATSSRRNGTPSRPARRPPRRHPAGGACAPRPRHLPAAEAAGGVPPAYLTRERGRSWSTAISLPASGSAQTGPFLLCVPRPTGARYSSKGGATQRVRIATPPSAWAAISAASRASRPRPTAPRPGGARDVALGTRDRGGGAAQLRAQTSCQRLSAAWPGTHDPIWSTRG